jgi:hypothetical protein
MEIGSSAVKKCLARIARHWPADLELRYIAQSTNTTAPLNLRLHIRFRRRQTLVSRHTSRAGDCRVDSLLPVKR